MIKVRFLKADGTLAHEVEAPAGTHLLELAQQEVTRVLFSPDSKRVAYTVRLGEKRMAVILDGQPQKEQRIPDQRQPDGNRR